MLTAASTVVPLDQPLASSSDLDKRSPHRHRRVSKLCLKTIKRTVYLTKRSTFRNAVQLLIFRPFSHPDSCYWLFLLLLLLLMSFFICKGNASLVFKWKTDSTGKRGYYLKKKSLFVSGKETSSLRAGKALAAKSCITGLFGCNNEFLW